MAIAIDVVEATHSCLRVSQEIAAWICDTFDYNLGIENDFDEKNIHKESCW